MTHCELFLRQEFTKAFLKVWETQVGLPIHEEDTSPYDDATQSAEPCVGGIVWIGGQWLGSVTLIISESLAREIAARLLEVSPDEVLDVAVEDVVRELTNMSAGNLKSALPGPSGLATPGSFRTRPSKTSDSFSQIIRLNFSSGGRFFSAELHGLQ